MSDRDENMHSGGDSTKKAEKVDDENSSDSDSDYEEEEKFDWDKYLAETKSKPAAVECFWQAPTPPPNRFEIGQKLEAVDPRNSTITSLATVVGKYGPRIKLHLEGTSKTDDFWVMVDSSKIYPYGHTEEHDGHLQPPIGFEKDPVRYPIIVAKAAKELDTLAPANCFLEEPTRPVSNQFKIGSKLEALDTRNPTWVCPATVVGRERDKIRIEFDGWNQTDFVRYDSRDLFPCGWWKQTGIDLAMPPEMRKRGGSRVKRRRLSSTSGPSVVITSRSQQQPVMEYKNIFDSVMASTSLKAVPNSADKSSSAQSTALRVDDMTQQTGTPISNLSCDTRTMPKHAARKTIVSRPVFVDGASNGKDTGNTPVQVSQQKSVGLATNGQSNVNAIIPQPDMVIALNNNDPVKTILHWNFNPYCDTGPYLDGTKLQSHFEVMAKEQPVITAFRDVCQFLIDSADEDCVKCVFDAIPVAKMNAEKVFSVNMPEGFSNIIRYIPVYSCTVSINRALNDILMKLNACPNLLTTTRTVCDLCPAPSAAKKPKNEETTIVDIPKKLAVTVDDVVSSGSSPEKDTGSQGKEISKWTVDDVVRFIEATSDPQTADLFKRQDIDGRALTLLTPEILIKCMDIRVGPAVKISNAVERLKGTTRPSPSCAGPSCRSGNIENQ